MAPEKRSFFERLTGTVSLDDFERSPAHPGPRTVKLKEDEPRIIPDRAPSIDHKMPSKDMVVHRPDNPEDTKKMKEDWVEEEASEGQLTVDVYQTPTDIVVKTLTAGVKPANLDISITRDMVIVKGRREEINEVTEENYTHKELYWGAFSRTVMLPQEIDVDTSTATESHGMLTIRMPKLNKEREAKLKVRTGPLG
jgi:HSP20 family protein